MPCLCKMSVLSFTFSINGTGPCLRYMYNYTHARVGHRLRGADIKQNFKDRQCDVRARPGLGIGSRVKAGPNDLLI